MSCLGPMCSDAGDKDQGWWPVARWCRKTPGATLEMLACCFLTWEAFVGFLENLAGKIPFHYLVFYPALINTHSHWDAMAPGPTDKSFHYSMGRPLKGVWACVCWCVCVHRDERTTQRSSSGTTPTSLPAAQRLDWLEAQHFDYKRLPLCQAFIFKLFFK